MRLKAIIPVIILVISITLFNILFLDQVVKKSLISIGQKIFQAKVDIRSAEISFMPLSLTLSGVEVANRKEPMTNLFQFETAKADIQLIPLLEKKFIINMLEISEIEVRTQRKVSGHLPKRRRQKKHSSKLLEKIIPDLDLNALSKKIDIKSLINIPDLKVTHASQELKRKLVSQSKSWTTLLESIDIDSHI
ncbi:MAG: hypothetical protein HRT90_08420, partial [Candidatus Margulisbacteria bacterium]|nr:hypothetical protein [Candidatus Margulisiibacteriota bacterium]